MNYIIADNINFFNELKKELGSSTKNNQDNKSSNDNTISDDNENICLITHQPLEKNYITLNCKHKFNYLPLYNEVVNQKEYTGLETTYLKVNEIKCPYCRTITPNLLPFIEYPNVIRKRGVNTPTKYCMKLFSCQWVKKSKESETILCNKEAYKNDNGIYCNHHHKLVTKKLEKITNSINKETKNTNSLINITNEHIDIGKKYKVIELRNILRNNNKKISGSKPELINRIIENKLI
jgi:hypothetical protein